MIFKEPKSDKKFSNLPKDYECQFSRKEGESCADQTPKIPNICRSCPWIAEYDFRSTECIGLDYLLEMMFLPVSYEVDLSG